MIASFIAGDRFPLGRITTFADEDDAGSGNDKSAEAI
jgi:hypothetical protein